jgi:SAM-dependent methyltransferase
MNKVKNNDGQVAEPQVMAERYARRKAVTGDGRYSMFSPAVYMGQQEKERVLIRWLSRSGLLPLHDKRLLEVGCGAGGNLIDMMRLGFRPENLVGNELLPDRAAEARARLPVATQLLAGDAAALDFGPEQFDVVYQSTVFTSILDDAFQARLAAKMWAMVKPGGYVLWYDFVYDNPKNPDVRGVPVDKIRNLFPEGKLGYARLTLAPPISRRVAHLHPRLYDVFNALPFLRTHVLCWIQKK